MADNLAYTPGTGATLRTDDRSGIHYPVALLANAKDGATDLVLGKYDTYHAFGRTTTPGALSHAFGGAGWKQFMTLHKPAADAKLAKIRQAGIRILETSAAATLIAELRRIGTATDPATGNPAIAPIPSNPASAACQTDVLCLPTTEGNDVATNQAIGTTVIEAGITAADSTVNPVAVPVSIVLFDATLMHECEPPTLRASTREGWAIYLYASAAATVKAVPWAVFTEE